MDHDLHISRQELLSAADGELSEKRAARVRRHLNGCWGCRAQMAEIEAAIANVIHLHRDYFDPQLPPPEGPRALLKARLAELSAAPHPDSGWKTRLAYASAVLAFLLGAALAARHALQPHPAGFDYGPSPLARLTPGATRPVTRDEVCVARDPSHKPGGVEMVPASLRQQVFQEYGIANAKPEAYEVDYLITPELGGASDIRNLWPEPYSSTAWNAHVKDALEDRLHEMVCAGEIDLATAQHDISADWIQAYKKYFHTEKPLSGGTRGKTWE